jgi:hypothetical protein
MSHAPAHTTRACIHSYTGTTRRPPLGSRAGAIANDRGCKTGPTATVTAVPERRASSKHVGVKGDWAELASDTREKTRDRVSHPRSVHASHGHSRQGRSWGGSRRGARQDLGRLVPQAGVKEQLPAHGEVREAHRASHSASHSANHAVHDTACGAQTSAPKAHSTHSGYHGPRGPIQPRTPLAGNRTMATPDANRSATSASMVREGDASISPLNTVPPKATP